MCSTMCSRCVLRSAPVRFSLSCYLACSPPLSCNAPMDSTAFPFRSSQVLLVFLPPPPVHPHRAPPSSIPLPPPPRCAQPLVAVGLDQDELDRCDEQAALRRARSDAVALNIIDSDAPPLRRAPTADLPSELRSAAEGAAAAEAAAAGAGAAPPRALPKLPPMPTAAAAASSGPRLRRAPTDNLPEAMRRAPSASDQPDGAAAAAAAAASPSLHSLAELKDEEEAGGTADDEPPPPAFPGMRALLFSLAWSPVLFARPFLLCGLSLFNHRETVCWCNCSVS